MPVKFKTTKIAGRAQADPLLYEVLRDMGQAGEQMALATAATDARVSAVEAILADGDKGDITVSGTGTAWAVDPLAVTYPKIQQVTATNRLLGRASAGAGVIEEITVGTGLSFAATTLNVSVAGFPTGGIVMWGTATAPTGYLLCDGAAVSRTTYAALFAVIVVTFGAGDTTTTFNVPDLRQRFPLGVAAAGTGSTLAGTGGAIDHTHTADPPSTTSGAPSATVDCEAYTFSLERAASSTHTHATDITSFNTGTGNPPFIALNFIIKT